MAAASSSKDRPFACAVDGPAASGKGTLARKLSEHFGLRYIDTGRLYRLVGVEAMRRKVPLDDGAAIAAVARALDFSSPPRDDEDQQLRTDAAAQAASRVSALPEVRAALLQAQRDFAEGVGGGGAAATAGAVLDGRDIGTVVLPHAPAKLFVTASAEVRARRRYEELLRRSDASSSSAPSFERVLEDLRARDARDEGRAVSPLRPAADAFVLDTTEMDARQAFEAARAFVEERVRRAVG